MAKEINTSPSKMKEWRRDAKKLGYPESVWKKRETTTSSKREALEKVKTKWKNSNEVGPAYTKREAKAADKAEEKRINKYFD